jgi:hypothetical protein
MEGIGAKYDLINRLLLRYYAIPLMRERLLMLKGIFVSAIGNRTLAGALTRSTSEDALGISPGKLETRERSVSRLPDLAAGPRKEKNIHAHWDGNNSMMEERNKSAAFGTGAFPPTIDLKQMARIEQWLLHKEPPKYPFPINGQLSAQGEKLYAQYCGNCHGRNGRDFNGDYVGDIVPIDKVEPTATGLILTEELAAVQIRSTPVIRGALVISAKLLATSICRWMVSGYGRHICTTALYRRCVIC